MTGCRIDRGARRALAGLCILAALAGCAGRQACTKPGVYADSSTGPPLRVPPDLSQPPENDAFEVPPGPVTTSAPPCGHYPPKVTERTSRTASAPGTRQAPPTAPPAQPATPPPTETASTPTAPPAKAPDVPIATPPAATPAPPAPPPEVAAAASGPPPASEDELRELIVAWAGSWSDGDFEQYLSYYAQDFDPPGDLTLEEWRTARRSRLDKRPTMTVSPETLTVVEAGAERAVVEFVQRSELEGVGSTLRKGLVLVREGPVWRIQQELIVDVLSDPR